MRIKQSELQHFIKESIKKTLLNEISIKDKYQKEQSKLNIPFDTFEQLCNLDPTTKPNKVGKYVNWIIAKYNPNADLRKLRRCLEWYCDGVKRGILTRYNIPLDINKYKSYDEFISAMDSLSDGNDTSMSQSEYNNRQKLEGQFEVLGSTSFYDIVAPKTYAAERYFGSNTEWCTVANESYFMNYSSSGQLYIIYPKNGGSEYKMQFHFEERQFADKYDEVYDSPIDCIEEVVDNEGVGQDLVILCKKVFSEYNGLFLSFNERIEDAKQRLLNGESPTKIFDKVDDFSEGYAAVLLNRKWNFINTECEILSDEWFDDTSHFGEGYAVVSLNYKDNFINTNGELLSDTWFDNAYDFSEGYAIVSLNYNYNFINTNGELLSNTWFDECGDFDNGFARVKLNDKYNYINTNGELLSDTWFEEFGGFYNGFARVELNDKYNLVNTNGELISDTWFDFCGYFYDGFASVKLNGKWNFINRNGEFLSDTWFEECSPFHNGFALIKLNGKYNFINTNCEFLSNTWFEEYKSGYYSGCNNSVFVFLNGEKYEINKNGELYDSNGELIHTDIRNGININENKSNNMRIKQSELQYLIKESIKKVLLNEISIEDKYQKERDRLNIPFDIFRQLCNLDPTTKPNKVGKYTNWIIAKYNPNADLRKLKRCLEWYCDGVKRGILTRYNIPLDINKYKSYDEFMTTMDSLSDGNDTSMSQSEYNNRQKLEGQFEVLGSTSFYDIVAPKTYAAERYFGSNTEWCTVANERYFDNYSRRGQLYIIYPKNGDSEYKMQFHFEDKQFADKYDEVYDRPMDCIQQVVKDEGVEHELLVLCKKVFSKYKELFVSFNERLEDAKQRLLNGESLEKIFNYVGIFSEGYAVVFLNSKWNFINTNGEFLSDTWFDGCGEFHKGFAKVCLKYKENYINTNGELISDTWFDECKEFPNGVFKVNLNGKENFINTNGEFLSDTWFDRCGFLRNGFAVVELNHKDNLVNTNGELLSDTWFDKCREFDKGFALVKLKGKYNFINANGELLSKKTWFDKCGNWSGAAVPVELNGKWNYVEITGELLNDTWFDWCGNFDNGFALIKLNGKYNFINRNGKILSDTWFDEFGCWCDGIGRVKVNGKEYEIETNGNGKLYSRDGKLIQKNIRNGFNINESKLKKIIRKNY